MGTYGSGSEFTWVDVLGGAPELERYADLALWLSVADQTPSMLLCPRRGGEVADSLAGLVDSVRYAVKAGPYLALLSELARRGHGFDIASLAEFSLVRDLVEPSLLLCSNPAASPNDLSGMLAGGVRVFVVDAASHAEQLCREAVHLGIDVADLTVLVRLSFADPSARYHLAEKFGISRDAAVVLVRELILMGLVVGGVAFHLGSQASSVDAARGASSAARSLLAEIGVFDPVVDVGGGFSVAYVGEQDFEDFAKALAKPLSGVSVLCEPGRAIAAASGCLVSRVISVARRDGGLFVHIDAGAYHGLMEFSTLTGEPLIAPFGALLQNQGDGFEPARIVGPTCDSLDALFGGAVPVPCGIAVDDILIFGNVGAYCVPCSAPFNGFSVPDVVVVDY